MTNQEIAQLLRQVAAAFTITDEKKFHFQIVAYQKAADTIANASTQVADLYKENKLNTLSGVGSSIQQHLEELIKTGKVKHFESVMKNIPKSVYPLLSIPGFGPKKAYKLVTTFNLENPNTVIQDIKKLADKGEIAKLEGFGNKSQEVLNTAIKEFHKGAGKTTRMLLPFATEVAEKIVEYLKKSPAVLEVEPLGSLRRESSTVGDIDIAVATKNPEKVVEHFVNYPYKSRLIEKGPTTASLLTTGGQQVDLMTRPRDSWGALLQHFTGSKHHNVHLRDYALKKGLSVSEYGIKNLKGNSEKRKEYSDEEKFYNAIGLDWIPPEIREDTGEIELAIRQAHGKPSRLPTLIELKDIKGDLHIHSNYSIEPSHDSGNTSMEDMLKKAISLKYEYFGFSEHNPSISKHSKKQVYDILKKRKEYIEKLKLKYKSIRIINLLETDILPSGDLAIDENSLEYLDATIVSIHSSFNMNEEDMTKRVLKGLSHPKAKILAHPTGRMINQRIGYQINFEKVFDFARKNKKALEINTWPERSDLPDTIIRQAVESDVKMVIDTDSHDISHMDYMRFGVAQARRGWARKSDILNCLGYNEFISWIKS